MNMGVHQFASFPEVAPQKWEANICMNCWNCSMLNWGREFPVSTKVEAWLTTTLSFIGRRQNVRTRPLFWFECRRITMDFIKRFNSVQDIQTLHSMDDHVIDPFFFFLLLESTLEEPALEGWHLAEKSKLLDRSQSAFVWTPRVRWCSSCATNENTLWITGIGYISNSWPLIEVKNSLSPKRKIMTYSL